MWHLSCNKYDICTLCKIRVSAIMNNVDGQKNFITLRRVTCSKDLLTGVDSTAKQNYALRLYENRLKQSLQFIARKKDGKHPYNMILSCGNMTIPRSPNWYNPEIPVRGIFYLRIFVLRYFDCLIIELTENKNFVFCFWVLYSVINFVLIISY